MKVDNIDFSMKQGEGIGFSASVLNKVKKFIEEGKLLKFDVDSEKRDEKGVMLTDSRYAYEEKLDRYYFKFWRATLVDDNAKQRIKQTNVYVNPSLYNYTLDEVKSMLRGGAVEREMLDKDKNAKMGWAQIDPKEEDKFGMPRIRFFTYGYSFEKAVNNYLFKENENQAAMIDAVNIVKKGGFAPMTGEDGNLYYVGPQVRYNDVDIFFSNMVKLKKAEKEDLMKVKPENKQGEDLNGDTSKENKQKRGMHVS
ncbi:hypothetical protein [Olivibacter domesticus]